MTRAKSYKRYGAEFKREVMRRVAVNPQSLSNRNRPQHSLTALSRITHRGNSNP